MSESSTARKLNKKAEREKARRKEKTELLLWRAGIGVVALAFLVGVGVTIFNQYRSYVDSRPDYARTEYVLSDLAGVLNTEAEEEPVEETADVEASDDTAQEETLEETAAADETETAAE